MKKSRSDPRGLDSRGRAVIWLSVATMARTATQSTPSAAALDRDAGALQSAVADLVRVYQFRDRDRICCHDISVTQCYALETLVDHGPMRLGALAERLFLDKSTTSRVVGSLVKKAYVEQQAEEGDRRATALLATSRGRRLCARITRGPGHPAEAAPPGPRAGRSRSRGPGHTGAGSTPPTPGSARACRWGRRLHAALLTTAAAVSAGDLFALQ